MKRSEVRVLPRPPSSIKWGKVSRSFEGMEAIGIKKSFPTFSNKDYFRTFIAEWPSFVRWMRETMGGSVLVIVRDPRLTMLSWKTTFDALKESTENQCIAWNTITSAIVSSQSLGVLVVCYEDLTENPHTVIFRIAEHVGVKSTLKEHLPAVSGFDLVSYLARKGIPMASAEADFSVVENICGDIAQEVRLS